MQTRLARYPVDSLRNLLAAAASSWFAGRARSSARARYRSQKSSLDKVPEAAYLQDKRVWVEGGDAQ